MNRNDHHLIQQVLDGDVSPEAFEGFQQRLREEPELLELYGEYALLQHTLYEEFEGGGAPGLRLLEPAPRRFGIPGAVAVAAVLALLAVVMFTRPWMDRSAPDDVALLTFSVDAVWNIEGSSRSIGGATGVTGGSVLRLDYGRAGISLSPTVTAFVEGPAELTFRSRDAIFMKSGKAFFTVGDGGLALDTPRIAVKDFGAEFGIEVPRDGAEEILVSEGEMRIVSKSGKGDVLVGAGDAVQIPASGMIGRFPADDRRFAKALGSFRSVVSGSFGESQWKADLLPGNRDNAEIHTRLLRLPEAVPGSDSSVLLTTLEVGNPSGGGAADDGLSFMSFSSKGSEVLLFGDSSGTEPDDRRQAPVVLPELPDNGMRTVTLRYDQRTGDVSLHEGGLPLGNVICAGKIPPGSEFDEIRLGALSGSALAVQSVDIRVGLE